MSKERSCSKEKLSQTPYIEAPIVKEILGNKGYRDFLSYENVRCEGGNTERQLCINHIPILRLTFEYGGAPLLIVDTRIAQRRVIEWQEMADQACREVGYNSETQIIYAAKANPDAAIVYSSDLAFNKIEKNTNRQTGTFGGHETSSFHDLLNLRGLNPNKKRLIVSNGFIIHPDTNVPLYQLPTLNKGKYLFTGNGTRENGNTDPNDDSYARLVIDMAHSGFNIVPVLDSGELDYFLRKAPKMNVGLRLKFGKVSNNDELWSLVSRHGMSFEELKSTAKVIKHSNNLEFIMLHAMVGAAESIPEEEFVQYLSFAADKYFELKRDNPSLEYLNIGGGMAPKSEQKYDHMKFLRLFLSMLKEKAAKYRLPEPKIIFEFGSYVAAESGLYVFQAVLNKSNHIEKGNPAKTVIVNGGIMEAMPDSINRDYMTKFPLIAVNDVECPGLEVYVGDTTCDKQGKYSGKVLAPNTNEKLWVAFLGVGAYQDILAGKGGIKHCVQHEPIQITIGEDEIGRICVFGKKSNDRETTRETLGYTPESYAFLSQLR